MLYADVNIRNMCNRKFIQFLVKVEDIFKNDIKFEDLNQINGYDSAVTEKNLEHEKTIV